MVIIGIIGTIILLPLALIALAFDLVRFAFHMVGALLAEGFSKAGERLAFRT